MNLDEILNDYFKAITDKTTPVPDATDLTLARLNSLIEGIIGEDNFHTNNILAELEQPSKTRNELRAEQRKRLKQLGGSE